jgi:hypothetical protein
MSDRGQHEACRSPHWHDKCNLVTGRDRRSAANGESVPAADSCSASNHADGRALFDHLVKPGRQRRARVFRHLNQVLYGWLIPGHGGQTRTRQGAFSRPSVFCFLGNLRAKCGTCPVSLLFQRAAASVLGVSHVQPNSGRGTLRKDRERMAGFRG